MQSHCAARLIFSQYLVPKRCADACSIPAAVSGYPRRCGGGFARAEALVDILLKYACVTRTLCSFVIMRGGGSLDLGALHSLAVSCDLAIQFIAVGRTFCARPFELSTAAGFLHYQLCS